MVREELLNKVNAVKELNNVIPKYQRNIDNIEYELYEVNFTYEGQERVTYEEFLIVRYRGGAYSAICCTGDSFYAIMEELVRVLEHGNYNHDRYEKVKAKAIKIVEE